MVSHTVEPVLPLSLHSPLSPAILECCCGSVDCERLKQNCAVLDTVEKDVHTAARLGQVRDTLYLVLVARFVDPKASRLSVSTDGSGSPCPP